MLSSHPVALLDVLWDNVHKEDISVSDLGAYSKSIYYFSSTDSMIGIWRIINLKIKSSVRNERRGLIIHILILLGKKKIANLGKSHINKTCTK